MLKIIEQKLVLAHILDPNQHVWCYHGFLFLPQEALLLVGRFLFVTSSAAWCPVWYMFDTWCLIHVWYMFDTCCLIHDVCYMLYDVWYTMSEEYSSLIQTQLTGLAPDSFRAPSGSSESSASSRRSEPGQISEGMLTRIPAEIAAFIHWKWSAAEPEPEPDLCEANICWALTPDHSRLNKLKRKSL